MQKQTGNNLHKLLAAHPQHNLGLPDIQVGIPCLYGWFVRYIVACTHLDNGIGCRTAIMVASLFQPSGPVKYEAGFHSKLF